MPPLRQSTRPSAKVPDSSAATDAPLPPTGSSSNGLNAMEHKIDAMAVKIEALEQKINGLVNCLKTNEDVADLQARLGTEMYRINNLNDVTAYRAINILATRHDLLRVFFGLPDQMKKSYAQNLLIYGP